ncbi:MAG: Xaa-Pro peptidase family protein [Bacteroidota bacterium]|nr:Xaa-Pro peptidase family protein [Bacteroidota bacterium]
MRKVIHIRESALSRLRRAMRHAGLDAVYVSEPTTIRLLTGFTGSSGAAVVSRSGTLLVTDPRYSEQAERETHRVRLCTAVGETVERVVARSGIFRRARRIGIDERHLTLSRFRILADGLPRRRFRDAAAMFDELRAVKHPAEIAAVKRAVAVSETVLRALLQLLEPGMRERDIAAEITRLHIEHGAEKDAFDPIVLSGPRTSLIHGRPGTRRIRSGDLVLFDFGCTVEGYRSDITRTVVIGRARPELRRAHSAVLAAREAAVASITAGVPAADVDASARETLKRFGLDDRFPHALGHGIGLSIHEPPRIAPSSQDRLIPGMVFTIEPGVYIPRRFGIRIEDVLVMTERGPLVISHAPRDLIAV